MKTLMVGIDQQYTTISTAVVAASVGDTINVQAGTDTNDIPALINGLIIESVGGIVRLVATQHPISTPLRNFDTSGASVPDANTGHKVKSRAEINNRIEDNNGTSSYAIDLPNGGNATITGNVIEQGINNQNHTINAYGEEGNLHTGNAVTFSNNTVVNDDAEGRGPLWANNGATITGTGNTAWNTSDLGNGISPASFTALSARPTLDTSSTNSSPISAEAPQTARDAAPPVVTVSQSISGITTSTSNTLSGTVSDAGSGVAAVEIFLNSAGRSIDIGAATLNGSNWSYTVSNLTPGTYNFYAVGFDKAGNTTAPISTGPAETVVDAISSQQPTSTPTEAPQTARDAAPPVVTVSQSISGITTSTSNTLSGTVSDAGSGVAAVEIFLNSAGRSIDIGAATLNGSNWSYTVSNLTPGTYNFYAVGFDKAGNTTAPISTGPAETVVDAISSQQPTSTPTEAPQTARDAAPPVVTVSQSISGITTSTSNTLSGTVSDAGSGVAAVEIFLNSAGRSIDIGAATLNGSNWSYTVSNLTPGTYNFYAVGFDKAGNTTAPISTGPAETVVDAISSQQPTSTPTEAPQTARDAAPPVVTVSQSISGITTSTSNTLSGTVSDAGSGVAAVEIFLNSAGRSIDIGAATLNGSNWSYTVSNLTPGTYNFYAVGFDKAGNTTAPISTGPAETVVDAISSQQPTSTPTEAPQTATADNIATQTATAISAAEFTNSIGINTHLDTYWTSYRNLGTVISSLLFLGVKNVRDSMAAPGDPSLFKTVAAATGVHFDVYLSISEFDYDGQISAIRATPEILTSVEGVNEGDNSLSNMFYGGQTGYSAIAAAQTALYNTIKANQTTNNIPVLAPSYGSSGHFLEAINTASVSDYGNTHEYFGTGNPPGDGIHAFISQSTDVSGSQPVVATEAGYYTGGSLSGSISAYQHSGVSELVQAKYNLSLLFDDWKAGIHTTYLYELLDDISDHSNTNSEYHFGLFNADGTPKLAATAIHNLMATLADNGPARAGIFGYQTSGAPTTANSLLLEKSTGVLELAVWNDVRLSDATTGADIATPATPVTISFGQYVQSVTEYDPLIGTRAIIKLSNVDHVSIDLPDHPVIFEITPYAPSQVSLQSFVLSKTIASGQTSANLASTLVANAFDADFNALLAIKIVAVNTTNTKGKVFFDAPTQTVVYTAAAYSPLSPTDSFTYTLADARGNTVTGTVAIMETSPANTLYGTVAGERINAPATGWTLVSLAPGEQLYSDAPGVTFIGGADTNMYGGTANNVFTAGDGNHFIGAGDNARITLENGDNTLGLTGAGNTVVTGNGNNLLWKSTGNTSITMGDGNQNITAGGQNNTISIGIGTSVINVGNDNTAAGNERITVGGGTNLISAGGAEDIILVKGGSGNQVVATGGAATITIEAGTNSVVAQGANNLITTLTGTNDIATNGDDNVITLGSGHDAVWAGGNHNKIIAGSGTAKITSVGQHDTIDLTHGSSTLIAQGSNTTLILAASGLTPAQIFGNVTASGDTFDLRTTLAATNWDGRQNTLAKYLSVSSVGDTSIIAIDTDGAGPDPAAAISVLNNVSGLTYAGLLTHATVPAWT